MVFKTLDNVKFLRNDVCGFLNVCLPIFFVLKKIRYLTPKQFQQLLLLGRKL